MKYLVITDSHEPFYTNWFDAANHFNAEDNMIVFDLVKGNYTTNGTTWHKVKEDHL